MVYEKIVAQRTTQSTSSAYILLSKFFRMLHAKKILRELEPEAQTAQIVIVKSSCRMERELRSSYRITMMNLS